MTMEWTAKSVSARFAEASLTLQALPPSERRRPEIDLSDCLTRGDRLLDGAGKAAHPSPAAIANLDRAIVWSAWIGPEERHLVWARAARLPWKQICADLGCDRTTAWRRWELALTMIAGRLNAE